AGQPQHHCQLRGARIHRNRHDPCPRRKSDLGDPDTDSAGSHGLTGRHRQCRGVSGRVAGGIHYGYHPACQRRHVHVRFKLWGWSRVESAPAVFCHGQHPLNSCLAIIRGNFPNLEICMESIEQRVKKIVAEQLGVNEAEIKNESSFLDDLGADSLDMVELVMALEDEFATELTDEEAENITTVQQAIDYINSHSKQ